MKKNPLLTITVLATIVTGILWLINIKTSNEVVFKIAFVFTAYLLVFFAARIIHLFFQLIAFLVKRSGFLELKIFKKTKVGTERLAKIISRSFGILIIAFIVISLVVTTGWIIASLSATTIIIILLVLILLK